MVEIPKFKRLSISQRSDLKEKLHWENPVPEVKERESTTAVRCSPDRERRVQ